MKNGFKTEDSKQNDDKWNFGDLWNQLCNLNRVLLYFLREQWRNN